jgi:hypothetical protein
MAIAATHARCEAASTMGSQDAKDDGDDDDDDDNDDGDTTDVDEVSVFGRSEGSEIRICNNSTHGFDRFGSARQISTVKIARMEAVF